MKCECHNFNIDTCGYHTSAYCPRSRLRGKIFRENFFTLDSFPFHRILIPSRGIRGRQTRKRMSVSDLHVPCSLLIPPRPCGLFSRRPRMLRFAPAVGGKLSGGAVRQWPHEKHPAFAGRFSRWGKIYPPPLLRYPSQFRSYGVA